ncbi:LOW QUALITY PROTEIN: hypothetical protein Bca4012_038359 [Brassica carinata]
MDPDEHVSYNTSNNAADKDPAQSESGDVSPIKDAISSDPSSIPPRISRKLVRKLQVFDPLAHVSIATGADFGAGSRQSRDHNKTPISSSPRDSVTSSIALTPKQLEEYYRSSHHSK